MKKSRFRIDLGQGDSAEVHLMPEKTLAEFVAEIKASDEWLVYGNTAMQKSHIKRIVELD